MADETALYPVTIDRSAHVDEFMRLLDLTHPAKKKPWHYGFMHLQLDDRNLDSDMTTRDVNVYTGMLLDDTRAGYDTYRTTGLSLDQAIENQEMMAMIWNECSYFERALIYALAQGCSLNEAMA